MEFLERLKQSWKNTTEMVFLWKRTEDVISLPVLWEIIQIPHRKDFKLNQSYCIYEANQGSVEEIIHLEKKVQVYI